MKAKKITQLMLFSFPESYFEDQGDAVNSAKTELIVTNNVRERKPACRCNSKRSTDRDALHTVARDLRRIRTSLLDRESRRATLGRVDTLMDELENYMAEN